MLPLKELLLQRLPVYEQFALRASNFCPPIPPDHQAAARICCARATENAIRHGIGKKPGNCELRIEAVLTDAMLTLKITDSGAGCDFGMPLPDKGIGLDNVRERLRQRYGGAATLHLQGSVGSGVEVTLELPDMRHTQERGE